MSLTGAEAQRRYRARHKNDLGRPERERAQRRESYRRLSSSPIWRKQKNAKQKARSAEHRKDPKWRAREAKRYKERVLLRWLATRGWTILDYRRMVKAGCALCGDKRKRLEKDHSHEHGHARGLLCHKCNCSLGWYEARAMKVEAYLKWPI